VTWARLRAVLGAPGRRPSRTGQARSYLLSGLSFCGVCGYRLSARPTPKKSYVCAIAPGQGCGGIRIKADRLEDWVTDQLFDRIDESAVRAPEDGSIDRVLAEVAELEHRRAELATDYYAERTISRGQFDAADRNLAARLDDANRRIAEVSRTYREPLTGLRERWGEASFSQKGRRWSSTSSGSRSRRRSFGE
jgi:site-specific DNA recombinase